MNAPFSATHTPSRTFLIAVTAMLWVARWAAAVANALFDLGWSDAALFVAVQQGLACGFGALLCVVMSAALPRRPSQMSATVAVLFLLSAGFAIVWTIGVRMALAPLARSLFASLPQVAPEATLSVTFVFLAWSLAWFSVMFAEQLRETRSRADHAEARVLELETLLGAASEPGAEAIIRELWAPTRTGMARLPVADIASLTAEREYVRIRTTRGEEYLVRAALRSLHARLDPALFVQTHRSTIVNIHHVAAIERRARRGLEVVMRDGRRLAVGRNHENAVRSLTG